MLKFNFTERDTEYFTKWISFYPVRDPQCPFRLSVDRWGYFDPRPQFNFNITSIAALLMPFISLWMLPISFAFLFFGWGKVFLSLPFDTGKGDECESPSYGLNTYSHGKHVDELWVYWGKRRKHIDLPWHLEWYRRSILLKDGSWEHECRGDKKNFYEQRWRDLKWSGTHPYTYTLNSGRIQQVNATITVEETEWRRKWLYRLPVFRIVRKSIEIEFDAEVGERAGDWKGGVLGCGFEMLPGESPAQTLKRMEETRRFN